LTRSTAAHAETFLQCAEIGTALGVGDHDLAVEHGVLRQRVSGPHKLGKGRAQVLQIPAQQTDLSARRPPQQPTETVELGFIPPLGSARQAGFQSREHRRRHLGEHGAGAYSAG
jgi:hypothetical protein